MITVFDRFGELLYEFQGPYGLNLGLAWDGQHLWIGTDTLPIVKVDTTGRVVASYENTHKVRGLAWDNASSGNPWLWVSTYEGAWANRIYQFSPVDGRYTGVYFEGPFLTLAGG